MREPGEPPRPDELPGRMPEELPVRGPQGPPSSPATDAAVARHAEYAAGDNAKVRFETTL